MKASRFNRLVEYATGFSLLLMTLIGAASIFTRYVLNFAPMWTDEAIRYLFIYLIFLGSSCVVFRGEEIRIDLWRPPPHLQRLHEITVSLCGLIFLAIAGWASFRLTIEAGNDVSEGLRIPIGCAFAILPISCLISLVWMIHRMTKLFKKG